MTGNDSSVRSRLWRNGVLESENFPFEKISEYLDTEGCLVWVDIADPDSEHLTALAAELSLSPLAVEDAVGHAERAKATRYATHTFITAYSVAMNGPGDNAENDGDLLRSHLSVTRVSAFVLQRGIVTVHRGNEFDMDEVVQRWDENSDLIAYGPGSLLHGLLDLIVDGHFDAVQILDDQIESLEDDLFDDRAVSKEVQQRTYRVRKDLVELRRVVLPMREVVNAVLRHRKDLEASPELNSWFDDLYDHVLRAAEWTESLRDMVTTVFETNLSLQDGRLNIVMKKLTSWAAIIAVPTAITGYFGQNVPYPGFGQSWGFLLSTATIVAIALALYTVFKRRDWL
ncbi:magnesium transporter [Nakamurella silvestris]|nr:magnesium transporter [Nakamurella silvestris]